MGQKKGGAPQQKTARVPKIDKEKRHWKQMDKKAARRPKVSRGTARAKRRTEEAILAEQRELLAKEAA